MAAIPTWLIGTGVTAITITPQTVGPDGTFSAGSPASLTGHLEEIKLEQVNETENIAPMDARQNNEVIVASGTTLTLVEILAASGGNILAQIGNECDYVAATFARGGKAFAGYFAVREYAETLRRGKSIGSLRLSPCGIGIGYA